MIAGTVFDVLLRQIPDNLLTGVSAGRYRVYGSIIRAVADGRIVGHLQETAGLAKLALMPATLPLQAGGLGLDAVGHAASFIQKEQIKVAINVVHQLGIANLAAATAGIGVSVAGFAILSAKIGQVEAKVDAMSETLAAIASGVDALRRDRIADDLSRLRTIAEQMDEGWSLSDGHSQWRQVASEAHVLANTFERRAAELLAAPSTDPLAAEPFIEAVCIAGATRVAARMATGDDAAARGASDEVARKLADLVGGVDGTHAALVRVRETKIDAASLEWAQALSDAAATVQPAISALRDRQVMAAATTLTLGELDARGIKGRDWIELARQEENSPLICLLMPYQLP
jgi:hypothetical protein